MTFLDRFNYARRHDGDRESGKSGASSTGALPAAPTGASGADAATGAFGAGAGVSAREYVGWRAWSLAGDRLRSTSHNFVWEGPVVHADALPTARNANGIYAVQDIASAPYTDVWGEVALSGVVVVGERGYRGETAVIRSLYVGREFRPVKPDGVHPPQTFEFWPSEALVRALEARYHVEVHVEPESRTARYYREHPEHVYIPAPNPAANLVAALQQALQNSNSAQTQVYPLYVGLYGGVR